MYGVRLGFGKYRGRLLTEVPVGYLKWLLNAEATSQSSAASAKAELARRGERLVPAAAVLGALEEELTELVAEDASLPHDVAGAVADHVLVAFEEIRERYRIGTETDLFIPARREPVPWRRDGG